MADPSELLGLIATGWGVAEHFTQMAQQSEAGDVGCGMKWPQSFLQARS